MNEICNVKQVRTRPISGFGHPWEYNFWLNDFLSTANCFHIENTGILDPIEKVLMDDNMYEESNNSTNFPEKLKLISEAMCLKKQHEVSWMAEVVSVLYKNIGADAVIDIGSGKGYLSCELARCKKVPVLGLDSQTINTNSATKRDQQLARRWDGLTRRQRGSLSTKAKSSKRNKPGIKHNEAIIQNVNRSNSSVNEYNSVTGNGQNVEMCHNKILPDNTLTNDQKTNILPKEAPSKGRTILFENPEEGAEMIQSNDRDIGCTDRTGQDYSNHNSTSLSFSSHQDRESALSMSSIETLLNEETSQKNASVDHGQFNSMNIDQRLYIPITMHVMPDIDLRKVLRSEAPHLCENPLDAKLLIAGLHTCGSLAVTSMNLFLQDPGVIGLCGVGCCYQLMEEYDSETCCDTDVHFPLSTYAKSKGVHLGRNARNLASQAVHRMQASGQLQGGEFFWRALLDVLMRKLELPVPERILGMRGLVKKCKTFSDYAHGAFKKLGFSAEKLSAVNLHDFESQHSIVRKQLAAFFQLKLAIAPAIESLILADRCLFLLDQECISEASLVRLFDPVTSPRCVALIAKKHR